MKSLNELEFLKDIYEPKLLDQIISVHQMEIPMNHYFTNVILKHEQTSKSSVLNIINDQSHWTVMKGSYSGTDEWAEVSNL